MIRNESHGVGTPIGIAAGAVVCGDTGDRSIAGLLGAGVHDVALSMIDVNPSQLIDLDGLERIKGTGNLGDRACRSITRT